MKFTNPDFLWALSLILLPIIIHLFNFRRFKKVYFSNIRFLKTVEQQTKRHSQLRHLLVLISRILFVLFLVSAFAKPFIPQENITDNSGAQRRVAVFLDNSFSMQQKGRRGQLLEEGRNRAKEIVQSYRPTDKFIFVTNDMNSYDGAFLSRNDFMSDLRKCDFQPYSPPLSNVISELTSQANNRVEKPTDLFLISDFQKSSTDIAKWQIDSNINLWLLPLTSSSVHNLYVDSCWINEPITLQEKPVEIHFSLAKNFDDAAENTTVKLMVNGIQKGVQTLDMTRNVEDIKFMFRPDTSKIQFGFLEIDDYPITFDNRFYFSMAVRKKFIATMVNGKKQENFIQRFYEADSSIILQNFDLKQVDYSSFVGSDILIFNELNSFSTGLLEEAKKYVENGGRLIFIPSAEASMEEINVFNQFFLMPEGLGVDSFKIFLQDLDLQSNLFKEVFDVKNNQLPENIDLPFYKHRIRIKWPVDSKFKSLMVLGDGNPLLVSRQMGIGNIMYFTASLDGQNSNLGRHALFIPLFYNLVMNANSISDLYFPMGKEQIIMKNLPPRKESPFFIRNLKSNLEFIPGLREVSGESTFLLQGNIQEAGNFVLSNSGKILAPLSFNYPARESNLENFSVPEIKDLLEKYGLKNVKLIDNQRVAIASKLIEANQGVQLWKIFLILALMFLLIEVFLLRFLK